MPIENIPLPNEGGPPLTPAEGAFSIIVPLPEDPIFNITKCIGGGLDAILFPNAQFSSGAIELPANYFNPVSGFLPLLYNYEDIPGRNFNDINNIINLSPIPFNEKVNVNGTDQSNCSLFNRFYQAKILIVSESTFTYPPSSDGSGDLKPYMFYGDSEHISISDINDPSYQLSVLDLSINEIPPNSGSVYESAYFYQDNHLYKGVNAVDTQNLTLDPSLVDLLDSFIDEAAPISGYNDEVGSRWVLKNNNSNHEDWTFTHSDTPNVDSYVSFNNDHWWIYDFGENNPKTIGRVEIYFSVETQFRHYLVEISGSNNSDIFSTDPYNIANVTGDHWDGLGVLIENESDINSFGISQTTIPNLTPYRYYKLTFKGGHFQEDLLSIAEFKFRENNLIQPEIRMSNFYGLHLIDTILKDVNFFGNTLHDFSSYNSGYRIGTSSFENIPPINLGGGP